MIVLRVLMMRFRFMSYLFLISMMAVLVTQSTGTANAQTVTDPFVCGTDVYFTNGSPTVLRSISTSGFGGGTTIATFPNNVVVSSVGYNPADGFIYGVVRDAGGSFGVGDIAVIDSAGNIDNLGLPAGLPTAGISYGSATFAGPDQLILNNTTDEEIYTVDLSAGTLTAVLTGNIPQNTSFDLSFDPQTGNFFTTNNATDTLLILAPNGAIVNSITLSRDFPGGVGATAVIGTEDNRFLAYSNNEQEWYNIDVTNGNVTLAGATSFSGGPIDAAGCPYTIEFTTETSPDADGEDVDVEVFPGDTFEYTYTVTNNAPSSVEFTFDNATLPTGFTFDGRLTGDVVAGLDPNAPITATFPSGESTFTATIQVAPIDITDPTATSPVAGQVSNQANITSSDPVFTTDLDSDDPSTTDADDETVITLGVRPIIQLFDSAGTLYITDGDATPETTDGTDFGDINIGDPAVTSTFTIRNAGNTALDLNSLVSSNPTNFAITLPASTSLNPGATTTFDIAFSSATEGTNTATISIDNNDDDSERTLYTFNVTGSATDPTVPPAPDPVDTSDGDSDDGNTGTSSTVSTITTTTATTSQLPPELAGVTMLPLTGEPPVWREWLNMLALVIIGGGIALVGIRRFSRDQH